MATDSSTNLARDEGLESGGELGNRFLVFQAMPGWLVSFIIHLVLIILLAIFTFDIPGKVLVSLESGDATEDVAAFEDISFDSEESTTNELEQNTEVEMPEDTLVETFVESDLMSEDFSETFSDYMSEMTEDVAATDMEANAFSGMQSGTTSALAGRTASNRARQAQQNGASAASENAVELALKWIAAHQLPDGSWSFDHRAGPGTHRTSPNAGDFGNANRAATAMALLSFLGAGYTHQQGPYQDAVERALAYLISGADKTRNGWSWWEDQGAMYNHGLVSIALCEAYAMTGDVRLLEAASKSIDYIEFAQDPFGGGWRYEPRDRGDLSVAGWQIMAIKSAHMCGIEVDSEVIRKTRRFLNFVSGESGAFYGYVDPPPPDDRRKGMTAVGLLCQMYLGWTQENPALVTGSRWLGERGPEVGDWKPGMVVPEESKDNFRSGMYYNYYATQVMMQVGGDRWKKWNEEMRDFLVATQATEGAAKGSWFFQHPDELGYIHGGRLYATTLAVMTLEVYYRYQPLYNKEKVSSTEFELD